MRWLAFFLFSALWSVVLAASSSGSRLLVINEEEEEKAKYSQLWKDLQDRGYQIRYESQKAEGLSLFKHELREFDHVLILPVKSKGLGPALTPKLLVEFTKKGGNVLLALSGQASTPTSLNSLLLEMDIAIPSDRTSTVVDHFHYDTVSAAEKHDVLVIPQTKQKRTDVKDFFAGDGVIAMPHAVAQTLGNKSPLLASVLRASKTAYSYNPKEEEQTVEDTFATGEQISLVTVMQARNSARFTVLGSSEALEDAWFDAKVKSPAASSKVKTANREFAKQLTQWTFKEQGVLKVGTIQHYQNTGEVDKKSGAMAKIGFDNPTIYRIKSDVTFNVELSEYDGGRYVPPQIPDEDAFQVEFTMLSPYHRLPLKPLRKTTNSTIYTASFKTPDQWGIFSFRVNYKRPFMTNVEIKEEVTVRHFAHDEYDRSWTISGAWPWIGGIWVTIGGFVAFVGVWLYTEGVDQVTGKKKQ